ncbi:MAG: hypothetical protein ACO1Q7_19255 [Gemmatimonas sp.]
MEATVETVPETMLVIAFDGLLFDTIGLRADAVRDALIAERVDIAATDVAALMPSRTIAEAVRAAAAVDFADETALDLATLRAERTVTEQSARGAILNVHLRDRLRRAAGVTRIVIRADSRRIEVDRLLGIADLEGVVSFVRCSDDMGTAPVGAGFATGSSVERSYLHIGKRMYANSSLLGGSAGIGVAIEVSEAARVVARSHGFTTPENLESARIAGFS